jgi:hypothetical protein
MPEVNAQGDYPDLNDHGKWDWLLDPPQERLGTRFVCETSLAEAARYGEKRAPKGQRMYGHGT